MPRGRALVLSTFLLLTLAACSSGGGTKSTADPAPPPPPPPELLPPTDFKANAQAMEAMLTWAVDPESAEAKRFQVFRNGKKIVDLSANSTEYRDTKVTPGKQYKYEIRSEADGESSDRVSATVKTKVPPLKAARLEGVFDVHGKVTSSSGFSSLRQTSSYGWEFRPKCPEGSCRVIWRDAGHKARTRFDKHGKAYDGTYVGKFGIRCGSTETSTTVTIAIEVTQAKAIDGVWRATKIKGTLSTYDPSQLGCVTSRRTESVRGKLIP